MVTILSRTVQHVPVCYMVQYAQQRRVVKFNGRASFKKCKQLFEYQHLLLLRHLMVKVLINVVHFFFTSVNQTSVAAEDSGFPALVSNVHSCCLKLTLMAKIAIILCLFYL
jgi:hypothetical protein